MESRVDRVVRELTMVDRVVRSVCFFHDVYLAFGIFSLFSVELFN